MIDALLLLLVPFLLGIWVVRRLAGREHRRPQVKRWNRFEDTDPGFVHRLELRQKPRQPDPAPQPPETLQPNVHWLKMRNKQRRPHAQPRRAKQNKPSTSSPSKTDRGNKA